MKIKLFIDEDMMSRSLLKGLRARGIDVLSVLDEQRVGLDDASQLEYSTQCGRVLCTSNIRDFYQLHIVSVILGLAVIHFAVNNIIMFPIYLERIIVWHVET